MKLLTADAGTGPGDFSHAVPGELVYLGVVCRADDPEQGGDPDGPDACGCGRAFYGVASGRATTVATVTDLDDVDRDTLVAILTDTFTRGGWADPGELANDYADDLIEEGEAWPVGARLRRHVDEVRPE